MRPIATDVWRGRSVSRSCNGHVSCKTAEPIEMPFGMWGGVGHSNHVLDEGLDRPEERAILRRGRGRPIVKYRDTGA